MASPVYILGGCQTDFARNIAREGGGIFELMRESVLGAMDAAHIDAHEVEVGHVGNFVGELSAGQGMLGGFFGHIAAELSGVPASRHEGACASGSLAVLAAMADIESGRYALSCVTGVELMRNVAAKTASNYLGAAAWAGREAADAQFVWPAMFSRIADEYARRYGLKREHLAEIARKNFANAKRNPNAQTRNWLLTDAHFAEDEEFNPVVEGWMRRHDCSQITDGAASIFLASGEFARKWCARTGRQMESLARIRGWGHTTAAMLLDTKLEESKSSPYVLPWTRKAILDAYRRAGINGPDDLDAIETHDCFTISEYLALDHFGITRPGEAWKAIEDGCTGLSGAIPVNPSGGLMGVGHPVGATGVRMMLDASRQVNGQAGDVQVGGARTVGIFNVGGSGTTNCAFVVGSGN